MLALGTVALAIVSLVALLVTHADARGLIKQTRIASKQQHDDNKELVVSANRAWTAPFKAEIIHVPWNQEALAFDVWVENTGREPALNFAGQEDKKARKIVPMPQSNEIWDKIFDEFSLNVTFFPSTALNRDLAIYRSVVKHYMIPIDKSLLNPTSAVLNTSGIESRRNAEDLTGHAQLWC
jgi:hypothetical protein